jgi:uncharacterized protein (TIGR01777 family)
MKIVVAGGTGFLGAALCAALRDEGHDVVVLTRAAASAADGKARTVPWNPDGGIGRWASEVDGAGAVVNLAGESIAGRRWTSQQKRRIKSSRLLATGSIVEAIRNANRPPRALVNASAIGFYGDRGREILTESATPGSDFLADVCVAWEEEARRASPLARVAVVRTGVVLDGQAGALPQMMLPFKLFVGGRMGSGEQYISWIHRDDWVDLVRWILNHDAVSGPVNATAPKPVTNADFAEALGQAMGRPSWLPTPGFALRLALGEMAGALLLGGQRVIPERALQDGYSFRFGKVEDALRDALTWPRVD